MERHGLLLRKKRIVIARRWAHTYPGEWEELEKALSGPINDDDAIIAQWEEAIAKQTDVPYAIAVSSGRVGMTRILEHLNLRPEDEVIIPASTLGDLIPLIQRLGAKVVATDIDPGSFNMTAETIRRKLTPRTRAIIVLHAFGSPADMNGIMALANERSIPVIEDCAHAFGATLNGRRVGSFGLASFFSFETTKPVNTWGGGIVVTRDAALAASIRQTQRMGEYSPEFIEAKIKGVKTEQRLFATGFALIPLTLLATPGIKSVIAPLYRRIQHATPETIRYAPLQARLGLKKLALLHERIVKRQRLAERYASLLSPSIRIQQILPGAESTWYFFVVVLPRPASSTRLRLLLKGIDAGVEKEVIDDCATMLGYSDCPEASLLYRNAIALPMHDDLSEESLRRVADAVNSLIG